MKRIVITFGLISGAIVSLMMLINTTFVDKIGFDKGEILGYTSIVLSCLFVFFGVRSYRDNVDGGTITFGRALTTGLLIALISSICYVVTWEFVYYNFMDGFIDKYAAYAIEKVKASGGGPEAIQATREQMNQFKTMYQNPFFNVAVTFIEPFPIGVVAALISAAALKRPANRLTRRAE
jgi:uncharacterized protein DUF4199